MLVADAVFALDSDIIPLLATLPEGLRQRDDIGLVGPDAPELRVPTVSIVPKKKSIDEILAVLTKKKLTAGQGHFYGVRPLTGLKIPIETGVIRLSFLHYTVEDEISQLIDGLSPALG